MKGDRSTFFLAGAGKILIRLQLRCGDRVSFRQNIETEEVAGKIFQDRDLAEGATLRGCIADFPFGCG
jgi:hypothetical protein